MIQAMYNQRLEVMERPPSHPAVESANFAELFGDATKTGAQVAALPAASAVSDPVSTVPPAQTSLGDPDVQGWLNSYYTEEGAPSASANTSYQPAQGAGSNFPAGSIFGPDAIFAQALANQAGNAFATMTGDNPAGFTSQLPGIPTPQAQQEFDRRLALENVDRLQSGQPIDTTAYWSDPGPITTGGVFRSATDLYFASQPDSRDKYFFGARLYWHGDGHTAGALLYFATTGTGRLAVRTTGRSISSGFVDHNAKRLTGLALASALTGGICRRSVRVVDNANQGVLLFERWGPAASHQLTVQSGHEFLDLRLHLSHLLPHIQDNLHAGQVDAQFAGEVQNHFQAFQIAIRV